MCIFPVNLNEPNKQSLIGNYQALFVSKNEKVIGT
jgi:hypothetical protein